MKQYGDNWEMDDKIEEYEYVCEMLAKFKRRKEELEKEIKECENKSDCTVHLNYNGGRYVVSAYNPREKTQVYITSSEYKDYSEKVYNECLDKCFEEVLVIKEKYRKNMSFNRLGY